MKINLKVHKKLNIGNLKVHIKEITPTTQEKSITPTKEVQEVKPD